MVGNCTQSFLNLSTWSSIRLGTLGIKLHCPAWCYVTILLHSFFCEVLDAQSNQQAQVEFMEEANQMKYECHNICAWSPHDIFFHILCLQTSGPLKCNTAVWCSVLHLPLLYGHGIACKRRSQVFSLCLSETFTFNCVRVLR